MKYSNRNLIKITVIVSTLLVMLLMSSCECRHEWSEATCSENSVCSKCGAKLSNSATGHTFHYDEVNCGEYPVCTVCGEKASDAKEHSFGTSKCGEYPTCVSCGIKSDTKTQHKWSGNKTSGKLCCTKCAEEVTASSIKGKKLSKLESHEIAYVYRYMFNLMNETDLYDNYVYNENEVYSKTASTFGYSSNEMKDFWLTYSNYETMYDYY